MTSALALPLKMPKVIAMGYLTKEAKVTFIKICLRRRTVSLFRVKHTSVLSVFFTETVAAKLYFTA